MFRVLQKGNFTPTKSSLRKMRAFSKSNNWDQYGQMGVSALSDATPIDSGETAASWRYKVEKSKSGVSITWFNTATDNFSTPIAVIIQYGHGTRNGGYVEGRDYINPAMRPVFDSIAKDAWSKLNK